MSTSSSSASDETKKQPIDHQLGRSNTRTSVDVNHFVQDESIYKTLTRTATHLSTHSQDPEAEEYDFAAHLQHVLRKSEENGILRRETGVSWQDLTVKGDGSGLEFGPSMGDIFAAPARIPGKIAAAR
jgi:hypothetical protein